ncbi:unnamed protein product [Allacma fusca]|uniref:Uncharacterized protein n=1 Tax=Allacma fusca TaxID=39272 RepID=A0A8J2JI06_9HEXA|nr:unnamed protein product [Allacma fusca]
MLKKTAPDGTTVLVRGNFQFLNIQDVRVRLNRDEVSNLLEMQKKGGTIVPTTRVLRSKVIPPEGFFCETIPDSEDDSSSPEILQEVRVKKSPIKKKRTLKSRDDNSPIPEQQQKSLRTPSPDIITEIPRTPIRKVKFRDDNKSDEKCEVKQMTGLDQKKRRNLTATESKPKRKYCKVKEKPSILKGKDKFKRKSTLRSIKGKLIHKKGVDNKLGEPKIPELIDNPKVPGKPEEDLQQEVKCSEIEVNSISTCPTAKAPINEASTREPVSKKEKNSPNSNILTASLKNQVIPVQRKKLVYHPKIKISSKHRSATKSEMRQLFPAPLALLKHFKIPRILKSKPTENHASRPSGVQSSDRTVKAQLRQLFHPPDKPQHIPCLSLLSVLKEKNNVSFQSASAVSVVEDHSMGGILQDAENQGISIVGELSLENTLVNPDGMTDEEANSSSSEPIDWGEVLLLHPEDRDLYRLF